MDQAQMQEFYQQYFYYILAAGVIIGLIFGAIPLTLAIRRKKKNLGWLAFILSGLVGAFSPLAGVITAIVFVVIVVRTRSGTDSVKDEDISSSLPPK